MSHEDEECLKLGREVLRLVAELGATAKGEAGYVRRRITHRAGWFDLLIVNDAKLSNLMEDAAAKEYDVETVTHPSQGM